MTLLGNLFGHLFGESASEFEARGDQFASVNNWRRAHGEYERALQKTSRSSDDYSRLAAKLDEARLQSFESLIEDIHSRIDVREFTFATDQIEVAREMARTPEQRQRLQECEERLNGARRHAPRPAARVAGAVEGESLEEELQDARPSAGRSPRTGAVTGNVASETEFPASVATSGRSAARLGERDPKQAFMRLLEGMPPKEIEARTSLGPAYQRAAVALARGDASQAADLLLQLRAERPESRLLFFDTCEALQAAGRIDEAVTLYVERLELFPNEWQTWYDLSQALWKAGEKEEALQVVEAGVERNPRSGHLMAQWGVFLIKVEKPQEALDKMYMALQLDSFDDAGLYHAIANLHQELGDQDKARRAFLKALEIQPRSIGTQLDYAEMLVESEDGRAALAILETAFRTIRSSGAKRVYRAYASFLSSKAHLMLGEREMALLAVSRALEDNDQEWLVPTLQAQRQAVLSV